MQTVGAAVLGIDIVAWSREFDTDQIRMVERLYRALDQAIERTGFSPADMLPTGDGALLIFEDTAQAALEVAQELHHHLEDDPRRLPIRMGIHAGSLQRLAAHSEGKPRYAGRAINLAVRVLDLGDEGHVLISGTAAEALKGQRMYAANLRPLPGNPVRVKHGVELEIYNYVSAELGNAKMPRGRNSSSWAGLFDTLVDAAMFLEDSTDARKDIEGHIKSGTVIPSRYHYSCDACAQNWLHRSAEPAYRHQRRTTEFWAGARGKLFADAVREAVGSDTFDFISLGPGDGEKDSRLASHWFGAGVDLLYYPYDVSLPLTARAVQTVRKRVGLNADRQALRVKAVLADFQHVEQLHNVFRHRDARNVVALMGTLGNLSNEMDMLWHLRDSMDDGDLLILEVRLQSDEDPEDAVSDDSLRHDFGPLENYLGMEFDRSRMEYTPQLDISAIPRTETTVVTYEGEVPSLGHRKVKLQYIHRYDAVAFLERVGDVNTTGFHVVDKHIDYDGAFLECLLRRGPRLDTP